MRAQLIPVDGGAPIDIDRDITLVGRKESCDLRLDHKSVSKLHCVIVKTDGLLLMRDLGSTNGTRVNGRKVRRAALLPNDCVNIASFAFRVFLGPSEPAGGPAEHTQQMDAREVAALIKEREQRDAAGGAPELQVKINSLSDDYSDEIAEPPASQVK
jgi:pSer/pThr/pTyr-binding forkhead associated (FHA) protein